MESVAKILSLTRILALLLVWAVCTGAWGAETRIQGTHDPEVSATQTVDGDKVTAVTLQLKPNTAFATPSQVLQPFLTRLSADGRDRTPTLISKLNQKIGIVSAGSGGLTIERLENAFKDGISEVTSGLNPPLDPKELKTLTSALALLAHSAGKGKEDFFNVTLAAFKSPQPSGQPSGQGGATPTPTPGSTASNGNGNGQQPSPTPSAREQALENALRQAAQQQALENAARQAAAEQAAKEGAGKGGSGGSGSGSGGGKGGSGGSGNDSSDSKSPKGLDEALKHLDKKKNEPTLSEIRNSFPDPDKGRGAKEDEKKKEENKFNSGSSKGASKNALKTPKELDDKKSDLTSANSSPLDPTAGVPGNTPNVKSAILSGPTSVPNAISEQYGSPSNTTVDASFNGGDSGGGGTGSSFGGASVSGGPAGAGTGAGAYNFNSIGQADPYIPEPPIKKILLDVQSVSASTENEGETPEAASSQTGDYTSKNAVKRGEGLFVNQILLSSLNPRTKGRGIMAYVGGTREMCQGPQGKQMALCELRKKGELSKR